MSKQAHVRPLFSLTLIATALTLIGAPVVGSAQSVDELKAELAAQKARLESLERKLSEVAKPAAAAPAHAAAPAAAAGNLLPAGVSLYGIADIGVESGDYGYGRRLRVQSGLATASRVGMRGERKIGDESSAYFQLEAGVSIDNGQSTTHSTNISTSSVGYPAANNTNGVSLFSRNAFVGVKGFGGDLRAGRDYTPFYNLAGASDPFGIGGATAWRLANNNQVARFDNGLFYSTPVMGGFQANLAYTAGMENNQTDNAGVPILTTGGSASPSSSNGNTGIKNEGKGTSASLTWRNQDIMVGASMLSYYRAGTVSAPATEEPKREARSLGITWDLKSVKLFAQTIVGKDTQAGAATPTTNDNRIWWLGAVAPIGSHQKLRVVYGSLDDRSTANKDATHLGLGYEYSFDSKTDFYAHYAKVTNKNGGTTSLAGGGTNMGFSNVPANFGPSSLMVGVRYAF